MRQTERVVLELLAARGQAYRAEVTDVLRRHGYRGERTPRGTLERLRKASLIEQEGSLVRLKPGSLLAQKTGKAGSSVPAKPAPEPAPESSFSGHSSSVQMNAAAAGAEIPTETKDLVALLGTIVEILRAKAPELVAQVLAQLGAKASPVTTPPRQRYACSAPSPRVSRDEPSAVAETPELKAQLDQAVEERAAQARENGTVIRSPGAWRAKVRASLREDEVAREGVLADARERKARVERAAGRAAPKTFEFEPVDPDVVAASGRYAKRRQPTEGQTFGSFATRLAGRIGAGS